LKTVETAAAGGFKVPPAAAIIDAGF